MPLAVTHSARADVGCRRSHNEDRYCTDTTVGLFIVCDGMGGSTAGEIASGLAAGTIHRHINEASQNPAFPLIDQSEPTIRAPGITSSAPFAKPIASFIVRGEEILIGPGWERPSSRCCLQTS